MVPLSVTGTVSGDNAAHLGSKQVLKSCVGIGNDRQPLISFEQRNNMITSMSSLFPCLWHQYGFKGLGETRCSKTRMKSMTKF